MSVSFLGAQAIESGVVASARPITLTGGAANVKGSYGTAHIAATAYPASWVMVDLSRPNGATDHLIDVAVGAAAAERVVLPNLALSSNLAVSAPMASYLFPLFIPAGSRISSRFQCAGGGGTIDVQVTLFAPMFGGERGLGQVEACGAVTATSLGTSVDPGGVANTKGTPSQLIAATTFPYKWVCVSINHTNVLGANTTWLVDIMVGAGGVEVVVMPDIPVFGGSVGDTNSAIGIYFPLSIPSGTRVSARCSSTNITSPDRLLEVVVHGVG